MFCQEYNGTPWEATAWVRKTSQPGDIDMRPQEGAELSRKEFCRKKKRGKDKGKC